MAKRDHAVFGLHAVEAVLSRRPADIRSAVVLRGRLHGRLAELCGRLEGAGIAVERAARPVLDRIAGGAAHQGIVLSVPPPREHDIGVLEALVQQRGSLLRLLVLDQVEDPRNLGACLRSADAAGVDAVVVPKARSAKLTDVAQKTAAGAAETVPVVVVSNLARTLRWLTDAGVRLVGAAGESGVPLYGVPMTPPVGVVLGAEGKGLRRLTREACDTLAAIPMQGTVASLNVSVAAGIMLFEVVRQMGEKGSDPH